MIAAPARAAQCPKRPDPSRKAGSARELARNRHTPVIEIRIQLPDPRRRLAAVRLAHELRERLPHELKRRGKSWELTAPAPDVARFEYQLELIDAKGRSEWIVDPANPKTASGPWGDKSVWEEPGYAPPDWVAAQPVGEPESVTIPSKILRAELPALIWAHPDATAESPMLIAHDGPEYAEHSALTVSARTAAAAPRDAARPGRPERDLFGFRALRPCARRGDPAGTAAGAETDRARSEPRGARALPRPPPLSRRASTRSSSSRAASSAAPTRTSAGFRATSGSPASSAASIATGPSERSRSCSAAAPSRRTFPPTGRSRSRCAAAATTRGCMSSATGTTGSHGATPSIPTCSG